MYICIYVYIHTYIHAYIHTYIHTGANPVVHGLVIPANDADKLYVTVCGLGFRLVFSFFVVVVIFFHPSLFLSTPPPVARILTQVTMQEVNKQNMFLQTF